jgi:hypothetical protein
LAKRGGSLAKAGPGNMASVTLASTILQEVRIIFLAISAQPALHQFLFDATKITTYNLEAILVPSYFHA